MTSTAEIDRLRSKIRKHHFVAISGTDDNNKTRLCNRLKESLEVEKRENRIIENKFNAKAGMKWKVAYFKLGRYENPYDALTRELTTPDNQILVPPDEKVAPDYEWKIRDRLKEDGEMGLIRVYRDSEYLSRYNMLIIIDQFENLFVNTRMSTEDKERFIQLMLNATYENEVMYVAIAMRPPKTDRWKYEFKELKEAVENCEHPVYAYTQEDLRRFIDKYFREESVAAIQRKTGRRNIEPKKLKMEKRDELARKLYHDPDPLGKLEEIITPEFIGKWGVRIEGKIFIKGKRDKVRHGIDTGAPGTGLAAYGPASGNLSLPEHPLADQAEEAYSRLATIQKRAAQKLLTVLAQSPEDKITMGTVFQKVGKFREPLRDVAEIFREAGVIASTKTGMIDSETEIMLAGPEVLSHWERPIKWGIAKPPEGVAAPAAAPQAGRSGGAGRPGARPSVRSRPAGPPPAPVGPEAEKAEAVYKGLPILQKRVSQKMLPLLFTEDGSAVKLDDLIVKVGKFREAIFNLTEIFKEKGVIVGDDDNGYKFSFPHLHRNWGRLAEWIYGPGGAPGPVREGEAPPPARERSGGGTPPASGTGSPVIRKKKPAASPQTRAIPTSATAPDSLTLDTTVRKAEDNYGGLQTILKRVCQKMFLVLAAQPGDPAPGYVTMADLNRRIGKFENVIQDLVVLYLEEGILQSDATGGQLGPGTKIRIAKGELIEAWPRLKKWIDESGITPATTGKKQTAAPAPAPAAKKPEPKSKSSAEKSSRAETAVAEPEASTPPSKPSGSKGRKKPKIVIRKKK